MNAIVAKMSGRTLPAPTFFTTLAAMWVATLLMVAAAIVVLSAHDIAKRMDQEKIASAQETMDLISTLAADMGGRKPHEFVSQMIGTGKFQRIGVYCRKQKVNVEGTPLGLDKQNGAPTIAETAMSTRSEVLASNADSITIGRPVIKTNGQMSGAVYITVDRTDFGAVFKSLMLDLAPIVAAVAAVGVTLALFLARNLSGPVSQLTSATSRIARGALDTKIASRGPMEFRKLSTSVASMVDNLKSNLNEINRLAFVDTVTRLPNRADFLKRGSKAMEEQRRQLGAHVAVLFIDLDGFKQINDTHGHDMGDKVLSYFAKQLGRTLRETDGLLNAPSPNQNKSESLPARLGGDEFTVLLTGLHGPLGAEIVAQRILSIVEDSFQLDGVTLKLGASIGIAVGLAENADFDEMLSAADAAMYDVKRAGKNNFKRVTLDQNT